MTIRSTIRDTKRWLEDHQWCQNLHPSKEVDSDRTAGSYETRTENTVVVVVIINHQRRRVVVAMAIIGCNRVHDLDPWDWIWNDLGATKRLDRTAHTTCHWPVGLNRIELSIGKRGKSGLYISDCWKSC